MFHEITNELIKQELTPQNISPENIISIEVVLPKPFNESSDNPIFDDIAFEQFEDWFHTMRNKLELHGASLYGDPIKSEFESAGYITMYQYAFPPDIEKNANSAILLNVRVSNYSPATHRKEKRNNTSLDRAKGLKKERWEPISIIVNEKRFEGYPEAIKQLKSIIVSRLSQIVSL